MGFFDRFKRTPASEKSKILLAMPLFKNGESINIKAVAEHLTNYWGLTITDFNDSDSTCVFSIEGEMAAVAFIDAPIPGSDISGTAEYAYNWPNAMEDLKDYTGHAIVSIMGNNKNTLERYKLLSKLLGSILATSNAVGIYKGNQTLLIPRQQYLDQVEELKENMLPVLLWIYIGVRKEDAGNSVYTYGLKEFGKMEMEIVNSTSEIGNIADFLTTITSYVIGSDVAFRNGETVGFTADQKIKITESKGRFVEGQTLKLAF